MSHTQFQNETIDLSALRQPVRKNDLASDVLHETGQEEFQARRQSTNEPHGTSDALEPVQSSRIPPLAAEDVGNFENAVEAWNYPKGNTYRVVTTFWALLVVGMNDGAYGALLPYVESYYNLSYTIVSLIFLSPAIGYIISAPLNVRLHMRFGQRGIAVISPSLKIISYLIIALHPPFPVLVVMYVGLGLGTGLQDAAWNAWVGAMVNANQLLGLMHGFYGLGATISPFVATSMVTKANLQWYMYFYVLVGVATIELFISVHSFWSKTGTVFRAQQEREASTNSSTSRANQNVMLESLFTRPAARITWLCALFAFGYVGAEVAIGGWIVTFMLKVRHGAAFASGMTATGFWLGITLGRMILGFVTPRIGEKLAIAIYLPISIALVLLFWLIPSFLTSAIFVALQGFFLGPVFPGAIGMATKLLPARLHVSAIGFIAAIGAAGGAVFPFVIGTLAQKIGVKALQPIVLGILSAIWGLWMLLPRVGRKQE